MVTSGSLPLFEGIRRRLSNRPDSEHGQAIVRLAILIVVYAYLGFAFAGDLQLAGPVAVSVAILTIDFVLGTAILAWIVARPGVSHPRRVLGMFLDYTLMGTGMVLLGEKLAPMYVILLWVTIGNGLRYGPRYLYAAIGFAVATFVTVIMKTAYWQANIWLGWGLAFGLVAVPLYLISLLRQLIAAMAIPVRALLRQNVESYDALGLAEDRFTDDQLIDFMLQHPILINRPIVVTPRGTRLCRPSEVVLEILTAPQKGAFVKEDGERVIDRTGQRVK